MEQAKMTWLNARCLPIPTGLKFFLHKTE